ncbi:addiction module protein [Brevibacterium aurantiacum]|nr:addiction module protein [Brevibacterium aurantiacum]
MRTLVQRKSVRYNRHVAVVRTTRTFDRWLKGLKDEKARVRILLRLDRLAHGNPGQVASIGNGLSELKINSGPGYRIYFLQSGSELIVLLCGGDKSTQGKDIAAAKKLADTWKLDQRKEGGHD